MATSARRTRPVERRSRFDLRLTAMGFALAAIVLFGAGLAGRVLLDAARRHPIAAVAVCLIVVPLAVGALRGGRRFRASRAARHATAALTEAAETVLEEAAPGGDRGAPDGASDGAPADGTERTVRLDGPPPGRDGVEPGAGTAPGAPAEAGYAVDHVDHVDYTALEAEEFERAVAALCERDGCREVEVVGGAGDLGADVVATAPDGRRVVIQCKRYGEANKVGSQDLQRFGGTCWTVHGAQVAAVVTTGDFTAPAAEYAERCGILCLDRWALDAWSRGTGPAPWEGSPSVGPPDGEAQTGRDL
ncbi:restriction endonuclease [Streptomyces sp. TRM43335]|uniref:Restriction endonuclease n=1 Tax=Streptomyces taklimakanensis TaxID=2569853 RepID=A0A6G2BE68_9ACTN|nr:restriction endonuclease [Streptomyces taklimakanensis]MTE20504.1 restriction endonuclease [Streptomyces taklimakanensis]